MVKNNRKIDIKDNKIPNTISGFEIFLVDSADFNFLGKTSLFFLNNKEKGLVTVLHGVDLI